MKHGEIVEEGIVDRILALKQIESGLDYYLELYTKIQVEMVREKIIEKMKNEYAIINYDLNQSAMKVIKDKQLDPNSVTLSFNEKDRKFEIIDKVDLK